MKISSAKLYHYHLKFTQTITFNEHQLQEREGLILSLSDDDGHTGLGEIAPLPGFSKENLSKAREEILNLIKSSTLNSRDFPKECLNLNGGLESRLKDYSLRPSVRFGIETAILNLLMQVYQTSLAEKTAHRKRDLISVTALLNGKKEEVLAQVTKRLEEGFKSFKLKVGRNKLEEDIDVVKSVNRLIDNKAILRVDANRRWTLKEAVAFGTAVGPAAVEYIEEPLQDNDGLSHFYEETFIPIALDESIPKNNLSDIKSIDGVEVVVLKPSLIGGIERSFQIMQEARGLALETIVSSSFESPIGISILAQLAACNRFDDPAGLDTIQFFKDPLFNPPLEFQKGKIPLLNPKGINEAVDFSMLDEIAHV